MVTQSTDPKEALPTRDHLFISYAWEDGALAEWLVRKLTSYGYRVWCDRFKVLGGENWPKDIDRAIKTSTSRMIALVSRFSLEKENPSKERQLALALGKERNVNFLIPLNVDGRSASEVGWQLSDLAWVPFQDWHHGLTQLLGVLEKAAVPAPLADEGRAIAIATLGQPSQVVVPRPEIVRSNCFRINATPTQLHRYSFSRELFAVERAALKLKWPFYNLGASQCVAFTDPPRDAVEGCAIHRVGHTLGVSEPRTVDGIRSQDIITNLIRQALFAKCVARGMRMTTDGRTAYFPRGLLDRERIEFTGYKGRPTYVQVIGERKFGKSRTRYHLGVAFTTRDDLLPETVVQLRIRLHVTDPAQPYLTSIAANARRKAIAKSWWNHEFITRQLAIIAFLSEGGPEIVFGDVTGEQVRIDSTPMSGEVNPAIDDKRLASIRERVKAMNAAASSFESEEPSASTLPDHAE